MDFVIRKLGALGNSWGKERRGKVLFGEKQVGKNIGQGKFRLENILVGGNFIPHLFSTIRYFIYSETSLKRTLAGQKRLSALERFDLNFSEI